MNKSREFILIYLTLIFLFLPSFLSAQVYDNIGFKKDIPEEIRKACSMCDEFLDVKWIDEKRYIGKLRTEWYKDGEKQGFLYLLVKLEEPGSEKMLRRGNGVFYEISEKDFLSKDFEKYMSEAELSYGKGFFFMYAKKGRKLKEFLQETFPTYFSPMKSYINFSKTICLVYPNKKYVLVIETKKPFLKNFPNDLSEKYNSIEKYAKEEIDRIGAHGGQIGYIRYCDAIDINFDGLDDYIFGFNVGNVPLNRRVIIYYSNNSKYTFKNITKCILGPIFYYKILEKEHIYISNCNLNEIIKGGN